MPSGKKIVSRPVFHVPVSGRPRETEMHSKPRILPLDLQGEIYALQDVQGNTIGTGTREVCEVLMYMINKASSGANSSRNGRASEGRKLNVRDLITI